MRQIYFGLVVAIFMLISAGLVFTADLDDSEKCSNCSILLDILKFYLGQGYYPHATDTQTKNALRRACEKMYPDLVLACVEYESINLGTMQYMFPIHTNEQICRKIGHCVVQKEGRTKLTF
uniref:Saposin B-type domain-containing protein n=1 Tax=Panagrellus redivivus TaxID=6233 RepID=A0A7E4VK28_PANRE